MVNKATARTVVTQCKCGAPCKEVVLPRGGDYGWGNDKSRTILKFDESIVKKAFTAGWDMCWDRFQKPNVMEVHNDWKRYDEKVKEAEQE